MPETRNTRLAKSESHGAPDCGGVALHPPVVGGKSGEVSCRFRFSNDVNKTIWSFLVSKKLAAKSGTDNSQSAK
jgi:hypothetical protein